MKYNKKNPDGKIETYEIAYSQVLQNKSLKQQKIMNTLLLILITIILFIIYKLFTTGAINEIINALQKIGGL